MNNSIKNLLVVGGGTAGYIAALLLKKRFNFDVTLIYSDEIGTIGVGEGSTEHFREFMNFLGISQYDIIKNCDATFKCGVMFEDWANKDYLHMVESPFNLKIGDYSLIYAKQIASGTNKFHHSAFWNNNIDSGFINNKSLYVTNQYHFNTEKLNNYLKQLAIDLGITVVEDSIDKVFVDEKTGVIRSVRGKKQLYAYDFYIDATGFKRVLLNELGAKWSSYGNYLKMKAAITFQTPDEDNYNFWTLAKAMDYGWLFRIPVWGRYGNGYVYDSDFITADQAKREVENIYGREIEISKQFHFDPGHVDRAWIKNCVGIGLSSSFVEPLEATSIGTSIQQIFLLMTKLSNYTDNSVVEYNKEFLSIMDNIRDFILLHYLCGKNNTEFWKSVSQIEIPSSLGQNISKWRHHLPLELDFEGQSKFKLFGAQNYIIVMAGLGLFDRASIKSEYDNTAEWLKQQTEIVFMKEQEAETTAKLISHKDLLRIIRNYL